MMNCQIVRKLDILPSIEKKDKLNWLSLHPEATAKLSKMSITDAEITLEIKLA